LAVVADDGRITGTYAAVMHAGRRPQGASHHADEVPSDARLEAKERHEELPGATRLRFSGRDEGRHAKDLRRRGFAARGRWFVYALGRHMGG